MVCGFLFGFCLIEFIRDLKKNICLRVAKQAGRIYFGLVNFRLGVIHVGFRVISIYKILGASQAKFELFQVRISPVVRMQIESVLRHYRSRVLLGFE